MANMINPDLIIVDEKGFATPGPTDQAAAAESGTKFDYMGSGTDMVASDTRRDDVPPLVSDPY